MENYTKEDYINKKVNLHIHTIYSDGEANPVNIVKQAKENGYKKIAICDHNTIEAHKTIKDEILIPAVEFDVWCGYVFMHLLAYNIDINNKELLSFCAKSKKETELDIVRIFAKRDIKTQKEILKNSSKQYTMQEELQYLHIPPAAGQLILKDL